MKLLAKLTETASIPGREYRIRELIKNEIKGDFDEVREDALGSLICTRKARGPKGRGRAKPQTVMLACHMDQIGFMVKYIDDKGFLRLNPVGGFDTRNLFARLIRVSPDARDPKKDLIGVMNPGGRPVHIATPEDRKKIPEVSEFIVDLGRPADEVKKLVKIGDMVTLQAPFTEVGNTVASQCLDNRVACWIGIRTVQKLIKMEKLKKPRFQNCDLVVVFTTQEEVGLRGAQTAAYDVAPDIGIAIDTTLCVDTPSVPPEECVTKQGDGATLTIMDSSAIGDLDVIESFEKVAIKDKIKYQRSILARGGTDAGTMQRAGKGCKTMTFSCPTRYIHTVTEMTHKDDLNACVDLMASWLTQVPRF